MHSPYFLNHLLPVFPPVGAGSSGPVPVSGPEWAGGSVWAGGPVWAPAPVIVWIGSRCCCNTFQLCIHVVHFQAHFGHGL